MNKHSTLAVSGKGGVGKSTVATLLIRALMERENGAVLAVDADPNSCLADYLGLKVEENIGLVREEVISNITQIPPGMTKERWISLRVQDCIVESKGLDLIEMGRPEGPGCYCYINNLLREYEASVHRSYRYIVIDNEAGMEHLSRRSTLSLDYLFIVSDLSPAGLKASRRIYELSSSLNIVTKKRGLILNRVDENLRDEQSRFVHETGLDVIGWLPVDPFIEKRGFAENSLLELPDDSPALRAVRELVKTLDI